MITKEIKASLNPADKCLIRMLFYGKTGQRLIDGSYGMAQLPARWCENQNIVHKADVEKAGLFRRVVNCTQKERPDQRALGDTRERCLSQSPKSNRPVLTFVASIG